MKWTSQWVPHARPRSRTAHQIPNDFNLAGSNALFRRSQAAVSAAVSKNRRHK